MEEAVRKEFSMVGNEIKEIDKKIDGHQTILLGKLDGIDKDVQQIRENQIKNHSQVKQNTKDIEGLDKKVDDLENGVGNVKIKGWQYRSKVLLAIVLSLSGLLVTLITLLIKWKMGGN